MVAAGAGVVLLVVAMALWLILGGVARGDEKARSDDKARGETKRPKTAQKSAPVDGGVPADGGVGGVIESARPVRVRMIDGATVSGTVFAEEAQALVIDCSLGRLAIPRARISTIAYDAAAAVGAKRAPVQQLDDEDKPTPPTKKRAEH